MGVEELGQRPSVELAAWDAEPSGEFLGSSEQIVGKRDCGLHIAKYNCSHTIIEMLEGVIAYEEGDWERAHIIGISDDALASAFQTATVETDKTWSRISQ